ncbi:hypothetical protein [Halorussus amylolyticus]|uniref:hypothetical protein n=1 Tax=Halorussus amylolyticus TaxID=1126242 RepID=UPI0010454273|nr:hypothetical protein [Halorussus amylolyticus]
MAIVNSLPARPLLRSEVDSLGEHDRVRGIYPIYGERPELRDAAIVLVVVVGGDAIGLGYRPDAETWERFDTLDVGDDGTKGIHFDDMDRVQALQDEIIAEIEY